MPAVDLIDERSHFIATVACDLASKFAAHLPL